MATTAKKRPEKGSPWTEAERDYVRKHFKHTNAEIAKVLGRTPDAVDYQKTRIRNERKRSKPQPTRAPERAPSTTTVQPTKGVKQEQLFITLGKKTEVEVRDGFIKITVREE